MREIRYSLVAAYSFRGKLYYYRLADYNTNTKRLVEADYTQDTFSYNPVTFYSKEKKEPYRASIKCWEFNGDVDQLQNLNSCEVPGEVFEIAYLTDDIDNIEYRSYEEEQVRQKLYDGFQISHTVNSSFLLVVGSEGDNLICLYCNKNSFSKKISNSESEEILYFDKTNTDVDDMVLGFPIYKIDKSDVININNLLWHGFSQHIDLSDRFFYSKLILPECESQLKMISDREYILAFFSKYFREMKEIYGLSNKEKNKFIDILKKCSNSKKDIEKFGEIFGCSISDIFKKSKVELLEILQVLEQRQEIDKYIINTVLNDESFYGRCLDEVKERWEKSTDYSQLKEEKSRELNEISSVLNSSKNELKKIKKEKDKLILEYNSLKNNKDKVENQITMSLKNYREDMVALVTETIPFEFIKQPVQLENESINKNVGFHIVESDILAERCEKRSCENFEELYEDLSDNLNISYNGDTSDSLAASILCSVCSAKAIILDEFVGNEIANCISLIFDSKNADKYVIYDTNVDLTSLISQISNRKGNVIYVEGLLNSFNETILKTLVSRFPSKLFIFGIDEENRNLISKGVWKYANYIDGNKGIENYSDEKYYVHNYDLEILRKEVTSSKRTVTDKALKKFNFLNDSQKFNLQKLLDIYDLFLNMDENDALCENLPPFYINQIVLNGRGELDDIKNILMTHYSESLIKKSILSETMEFDLE